MSSEVILTNRDWVEAFWKADDGDKAPLVALLWSDWELPPQTREYLADLIKRGVQIPANPPRPRATGLPDIDPWVAAVDAVGRGDRKVLMDLLQSPAEMPYAARGYIADLIERGIPKHKGRPSTPAYRISDFEFKLLVARRHVRARDIGTNIDDAIASAAEAVGLSEPMVRKFYSGKAKKLPPASPPVRISKLPPK
jgi:hypothetical protein